VEVSGHDRTEADQRPCGPQHHLSRCDWLLAGGVVRLGHDRLWDRRNLGGSSGYDGYAALVGLGVLVISPIGLACSTIFLVGKRHVVTFILCGVPTGLFAALWPILADPAWTINRVFGYVS
jgi:hypothetical protein